MCTVLFSFGLWIFKWIISIIELLWSVMWFVSPINGNSVFHCHLSKGRVGWKVLSFGTYCHAALFFFLRPSLWKPQVLWRTNCLKETGLLVVTCQRNIILWSNYTHSDNKFTERTSYWIAKACQKSWFYQHTLLHMKVCCAYTYELGRNWFREFECKWNVLLRFRELHSFID
jgi:hypothetical protein